jgi:hypothetical protein
MKPSWFVLAVAASLVGSLGFAQSPEEVSKANKSSTAPVLQGIATGSKGLRLAHRG